jgi:hypothetical protein
MMSLAKDIWPGCSLWLQPRQSEARQPWRSSRKSPTFVIMADDVGYWNISAYNRGMMGYRTPNIDRIANEGAIFTDYYGQQSCTAGVQHSSRDRAHCVLVS